MTCPNCSAPVVPPPPVGPGLEWVIKLQRVSASQNSPAPLGPNAVSLCSPTDGCSALVDSGTFFMAMPPAVMDAMLQLLGLPANYVSVTGAIVGGGAQYPLIATGAAACAAARARSGPTLDFQIQARGHDSCTHLSASVTNTS